MERAVRSDRPHALTTTLAAFEVVATSPSTHHARTWLQAVEDGSEVGVAELELPLSENTDLAWCELEVLPDHRRRGVGRALWRALVHSATAAGRTRVGGEVTLDVDVAVATRAFATAVGAVEKHREHHLLADLPVAAVPVDPAYDVVTWQGRCPDEHRAAYLAMRNRMDTDVPTGELELEPEVLDDARLAGSEERLMRAYDVRVAAPDNTAMHRTNTAMGFRVVEHMYEMEASIA